MTTMKIWRFDFAFAFVMERQINPHRFSFAFVFAMVMLGTHKLQQQTIFFAFAFVIQQRENPKSWEFSYFFACKRFCEDDNMFNISPARIRCWILKWHNNGPKWHHIGIWNGSKLVHEMVPNWQWNGTNMVLQHQTCRFQNIWVPLWYRFPFLWHTVSATMFNISPG